MNIRRIFANAFARRIAYVVVAAALAWMGLGDAKAQACTTNPSGCTRQQAYDACMVYLPSILVNASYTGRCHTIAAPTATVGTYSAQRSFNGGTFNAIGPGFRWDAGCGAGQEWNDKSFKCQSTCTNRPAQVTSYSSMIPSGSVTCSNGCEAMVSPNGDGTYTVRTLASAGSPSAATHCNVLPNDCAALGPGYTLNYGTSMCQAPSEECAENESKDPVTGVCEQGCAAGLVMDAGGVCKPKEDDCPAGNVRAPSGQCLPGDGQCAAGEARRANGTCGKDVNGDGVADEDDEDPENDPEEYFAGGDTCASPPSCSGGAVECGMARIQWRIDCNTRRTVNVTGGACSAMPVCVGENCKAMEYAQLVQQWRAACALEKMADAEPGEGGDNQDLIDLLTDPGSIQPDLGGTADMPGGGSYPWGDDDEEFEPDTSGMGWGSSCPSPPAISVFGQSISFNLTPLCNWLALAGNLVLILASLASLRIVSGGVA